MQNQEKNQNLAQVSFQFEIKSLAYVGFVY